jgi:DNA polymerase (family 10)
VIKAAADTGTALEINASYPRLDLNDVNARHAIEAGVKLSIDTDAPQHRRTRADALRHQRRPPRWVTAEQVINCWPLKD